MLIRLKARVPYNEKHALVYYLKAGNLAFDRTQPRNFIDKMGVEIEDECAKLMIKHDSHVYEKVPKETIPEIPKVPVTKTPTEMSPQAQAHTTDNTPDYMAMTKKQLLVIAKKLKIPGQLSRENKAFITAKIKEKIG